jgi:hypothetical protein
MRRLGSILGKRGALDRTLGANAREMPLAFLRRASAREDANACWIPLAFLRRAPAREDANAGEMPWEFLRPASAREEHA